jgi:agmatinase
MSDYPRFLGNDLIEQPAAACLFHVIPVPLERTVSYGSGTARGPRAILEASLQLESYLEGATPGDLGIHVHPPVDCRLTSLERTLADVGHVVEQCLKQDQVPIALGGEHALTIGAVRAAARLVGDFGVVQFDAHADLRETYEGSPLSHACVMRRIFEDGIPIAQIGVRSLSAAEAKFRKRKRLPHWDAADVVHGRASHLVLPIDFPERIYITFDVDVFDPSLMPATGTPEPGGLSWYDALAALDAVLEDRIVIGADFVELAPIHGFHAPDFTVAKLIYALMARVARDRQT